VKKSRFFGDFGKICAIFLFIFAISPSAYAVSRAHPPRQKVIVIHEHHDSPAVPMMMIGLGVAMIVYAATREYRDCTRLTYRF